MPKEYSPEEKLLNLIKKKKNRPHQEREETASSKEEPLKPKEKEVSGLSRPSDWRNIARLESIKILNTILFIALIAIVLYFLIDIFVGSPKEEIILKEEAARPPEQISEPEIKPYTYYTKELSSKDIFKASAREEAGGTRPSVPVDELMTNLSLLGIVSGENTQAIIEDKKQTRTYFLRVGQSAGGIEVKSIGDGTVTVVYKGEEFTLSL